MSSGLPITVCLKRLIVWLALFGITSPVLAALSDVRVRADDGATTIEVTFSEQVVLEPVLVDGRVNEFELQLTAEAGEAGSDWFASQLDFDEQAHVLEQVLLEGKAADGLSLRVQLRKAAFVTVLPQYLQNHVMFRLSTKQPRVAGGVASDVFVVTLESRPRSAATLADIPKSLVDERTVYLSPHKRNGEVWQHLRVGYFENRTEALTARAKILAKFPQARIEAVSATEVSYGEAFRLNPNIGALHSADVEEANHVRLGVRAFTPSSMGSTDARFAPAARPWQEREPERHPLLEQADTAFRAKNYAQAIQLYSRLTTQSAPEVKQLAAERLGIARELNGQIAQATRVFRDYLSQFPDGAGAQRVRLRLDTLTALTRDVPAVLRKAKGRSSDWQASTILGQYYRRHSLEIEGHESVPIDGLFTDVGLNVRKHGDRFQHEGRLTLTHLWDFTGELEATNFQVGRAYWDLHAASAAISIRLGRQSKYEAGVLGRFDGLTVSHTINDRFAIGAVGGFALANSFAGPDTQRPVYGVYGAYTSASGVFRVSPFVVQQQYQGVVDRQAVGVQLRYNNNGLHMMGLLDYDFLHSALNNASLAVDFGVGRASSFNLSFEQRRSPYVTTHNALIGQPFADLSELEEELVELSLKQLAQDRSAVSRSLRAGWNRKINARWSLSANILASDFSSTDASMNVMALEARQDLYYSMQVRALDVFGKASYSGITLRQTASEHSSAHSLFWDNRIPMGSRWMLQPRLRFDYRKFDDRQQVQTSTRPSIRLNYRWSSAVRFELEAGYEATNREMTGNDYDLSGLFINAGYRAVF